MYKNIIKKTNEKLIDKMIKDKKTFDKKENLLFILILVTTGLCILINNIAPLLFIFLLFYYEKNKRQILHL